jgi:hypothetical protein
MSRQTAERWVTISALIVALTYGYRRITEATSSPVTLKKLVGVGDPVPLGAFATAWGFTFLTVAIIAEAAPGLGGAFAILIATGDLLTNSSSVLADVTAQEGKGAKVAGKAAATTAGQATAGVRAAGQGAANTATGRTP